jgi:RNA polymerase sigma-70 factor (ECF subfamily)
MRSRFEAMFRTTYERVYAYALRRADRADVEDVVAETYAVAWRRFDVIPPDPLPWLYAVARRALANFRRSGHRRARLARRIASETPPSRIVEPDPGERLEDAVVMRSALRALKEADREMLMLVAWEGLDTERASIALGISRQAFALRLHRARNRLEAEVARVSGRRPTESTSRKDEP